MIGCGGFALLGHAPAQRKYGESHRDVQFTGCCDSDLKRALLYREAAGYKRCYVDIDTMLEAEMPDAIVLAVPPTATCDVATSILEKGIPVLMEKPPGMSFSELRKMTHAAERRGVGAQVAFNRRYMPTMLKALEILGTDFGAPFSGHIVYEMARSARWDPDFSTTAIHAFDAVLMLSRSSFRAAEIRIRTVRQGLNEAADVFLEAECVSGARVSLNIHPVSGRNVESAGIHAVGQSLTINIPFSPELETEGRLEYCRGDKVVAAFSDRHCDVAERLGVFGETKAFIDAVRSGAQFAPSLRECSQQVALMETLRLRRTGSVRFEAL